MIIISNSRKLSRNCLWSESSDFVQLHKYIAIRNRMLEIGLFMMHLIELHNLIFSMFLSISIPSYFIKLQYFTFQNESLTRQLNLTTAELQTLQSSQSQLLKSRQDAQERAQQLEDKIANLKERCEKTILEERAKHNKLEAKKEQLLVSLMLFCRYLPCLTKIFFILVSSITSAI